MAENDVPRFVSTIALGEAVNATARIALAITGTWARGAAKFSISPEDLAAIQRNFANRANGEINVDYDHASEMPEVAAGGPIPSAGRIVRLDRPETANGTGQFILWGHYEPTDRARELIANREYRYISPAIDWAAKNKQTGEPQGATLTSVALTNRPFLEELPEIRLSDCQFMGVGDLQVGNANDGQNRKAVNMLPGTQSGASAELTAMAKALAERNRIPFKLALLEVADNYPDLVRRSRNEVLGGKYEVVTIGEAPNTYEMRVCQSSERLAKMARVRAAEKGIPYSVALSEIGREHPALALLARAEVMGIKL